MSVRELKKQLRSVNLVSFSGGKDSTTILQLILQALEGENDKRLYIVNADTLMEIPYFQAYVNKTKVMLEQHIKDKGLNAEMITVYPLSKDSFWTSTLGKGYPAAHMGFRWCTGKLKIDPISKLTRKIVGNSKDYMTFVGVRTSESELRARIYTQKDYKPNHYAPILDWSSHDVWEFLLTQPCPWNPEGHAELINVYKYSSDECVYGEKQGVCVGNARYGCWACPLQSNSQLEMIGFHTGESERYRELRRYKNLMVGAANREDCRSRIRRNGEVGTGPFLVKIREMLHRELKVTESRTGWSLITQEEERQIFEHWKTDCDVHHIANKTQLTIWGVE